MQGDKSILILKSIVANHGEFTAESYARYWLDVWGTDEYAATYKDSAYKQTLKNTQAGKSVLEAGSTDDDIGHQVHSYTLLPLYINNQSEYVKQSGQLVQLCQNNQNFILTGQFFAHVIYRLIHSNGTIKPSSIITQVADELNNQWLTQLVHDGIKHKNDDCIQYAESIGTSCSTEFGLPEVIQTIARYEDDADPWDAIRVSNDIGGNNAPRTIGIASILYAYRINTIEQSKIWPIVQQIQAKQRVDDLLNQLIK